MPTISASWSLPIERGPSPTSPPPGLVIVTTIGLTLDLILRGQPRWLSERYDVTLVASPGDDFSAVLKREGVRGRPVSMIRGISPLRDLAAVWRMARILRRLRPEIVQSYTPKAGLVAMMAARLAGLPIRVHTFTGLLFPSRTGWRRGLLLWADRLIAGFATHVVAESRGVKAALEQARITGKRIEIIGHGNIAGVDLDHYDPDDRATISAGKELRQSLDIPADAFLFLFVGRLNADKGLDELIGAFALLPPSAHLLVVGPLDETAPPSAQVMEGLRSQRRIHRLDHMVDVRPAYSAADTLVLPSYREGFPNVLLEAAAMRLPLIATDISGCNELVRPSFNGWLVPPRESAALAEAMHASLSKPKDRLDRMGAEGRARIERDFERGAHLERLDAYYRSKLDNSQA